MDTQLRELWLDRMRRGSFFFYQLRRQELDADTRVLQGFASASAETTGVELPFCVQFNRQRGTRKRRGVHVTDVRMPFDPNRFNFLQVKLEEVLFMLPNTASQDLGGGLTPVVSMSGLSPHLVVINASPIEEMHVLFCPRTFDRLPQQLTPDTLDAALAFAALSREPYLRMGFNSLGAGASVNHLHLHMYHLGRELPVEACGTRTLLHLGPHGGSVQELVGYPIPGLCFALRLRGDGPRAPAPAPAPVPESEPEPEPQSAAATTTSRPYSSPYSSQYTWYSALDALHAYVGALQRHGVAHNVAITHNGRKVFVFPRQMQQGVNQQGGLQDVGCMEMMGHFIAFDETSYSNITHARCVNALRAVAVPPALFNTLKREALEAVPAAVRAQQQQVHVQQASSESSASLSGGGGPHSKL
eukprot:g2886.t1